MLDMPRQPLVADPDYHDKIGEWTDLREERIAAYLEEGRDVFRELSAPIVPPDTGDKTITVEQWDRLNAWRDEHRFKVVELDGNGRTILFGRWVTVR